MVVPIILFGGIDLGAGIQDGTLGSTGGTAAGAGILAGAGAGMTLGFGILAGAGELDGTILGTVDTAGEALIMFTMAEEAWRIQILEED